MAEAKVAPSAPRKRGRPRTVTDDQEVPERRRKQLRVAQQAYRKRKETTISNLQSRVQELESGIEDLSQSFLSFSNLLIEAKILEQHQNVTSALQKITQQCVALAKKGCDESEEKPAVDSTMVKVDRKKHSTPEINLNFDAEIVQGSNISFPEDPFSPSMATLAHWTQLPPTPPHQNQPMLPFGILYSPPPTSFSTINQSSLPSPPTTVSPSSLMQRGRWTLAHRLVRQCCQNGYWLLASDFNDDSKIKEVFKTSLSQNERNRMITSFYNAMHDEIGDLIEPKTRVLDPLYDIGEALSPEQLARKSRAIQYITELGDSEYMDGNGVQRYLERKGVRISDSDPVYSSPPTTTMDYMMEVNATSFIRYLSTRCICVGFGPAFKRKDVEKALSLANLQNQWQFEARY